MSSNTTDGNKSPQGKRQVAIRQGVHLDLEPFVASADYSAADLVATRALATWGPAVDVRGRDNVELLLDLTVVAGQTTLTIAIQASPYKGDADWYDRHTGFDILHGDSVAVAATPRDLTLDVSGLAAGDHRVLVAIRALAHYMRFTPFSAGTVVGSRCTIKTLRVTEGS